MTPTSLPYHNALSPYCKEKEWGQLSSSEKMVVLRGLGIRDMNVLIQCILWPTDNEKILPLKPFHMEMIRLFEACIRGDIPHKEVLYLIPRFHLKTQLITTAGTIWVLLNDPEETILVNSKGLDLAERIVGGALRPVFCHNALFRQCYPEWCPPENLIKSWGTQSKLIVENRASSRKEPSVMAGSFDAPKTGDHFGVILNDDPHNETNVTTIDQIQKVKDGWKAQGPLGDGKRTRRVYVATRWHYADVNDEIMQKRAPKFYSKFINKELHKNQPLADIEKDDKCAVYLMNVWADEDKTEVIWPEKEPVENIKDYREQWGSYFFSCQMENDPVPPEDRTFKPENFKYYTVQTELNAKGEPEKFYVCGEKKVGKDHETQAPIFEYRKIPVNEVTNYITVDPAFGTKPQHDHTGIVVCGHWIDPKSRLRWLIVLETVREKMSKSIFQRKIESLCIKWNVRKMSIEAHGIQGYTEQVQKVPQWAGKLNIEVIKLQRGGAETKGDRVTRLEPYYEGHRVWHHENMRNGILELELLGFVGGMSRGTSDDVADAMADHVDFPHAMRTPDFDPLSAATGREQAQWGKWASKRDAWRVI